MIEYCQRDVKMEMYSISSKLKNLRENRNMAQNEVAEYLGTSQQNYSRYENGRRDLPIRYLEPLTNLYHVSADYLLGLSITPDRKSTRLNSSHRG